MKLNSNIQTLYRIKNIYLFLPINTIIAVLFIAPLFTDVALIYNDFIIFGTMLTFILFQIIGFIALKDKLLNKLMIWFVLFGLPFLLGILFSWDLNKVYFFVVSLDRIIVVFAMLLKIGIRAPNNENEAQFKKGFLRILLLIVSLSFGTSVFILPVISTFSLINNVVVLNGTLLPLIVFDIYLFIKNPLKLNFILNVFNLILPFIVALLFALIFTLSISQLYFLGLSLESLRYLLSLTMQSFNNFKKSMPKDEIIESELAPN
jgi:hypothetical protein